MRGGGDLKAVKQSFRRALAIRFTLLIALVLASVGAVLYVLTYRTTTQIVEKNLRQTTDMVFTFVETVADASVRNYLRASSERAYDLVAAEYARFRSGAVSESAAQRAAFEQLAGLHIGKTGYVFVVDTKGFMVSHPSPGLDSKPAPTEDSPLADQLRMREGYLEYNWRNPEEKTDQAKAMYMSFFGPWNWIISVVSYRKEFDVLVNPAVFRDYVLSATFGKDGYVFIAHEDGGIVIHPRLSGNPLKDSGDPQLRALFETMRSSPQGRAEYSWRNPGDKSPVQKVVYYKQLPRFHWIVASTISRHDLYAPAYAAGLTILIAFALALALAVLLTLRLSARVTHPIESLAARLEEGNTPDFSVRMPVDSRDEIGTLAEHFNRFMDGLQAARDTLEATTKERTRAETASARLAAAVAQITEHVMITDPYGRVVYVNPAFETCTGYTAAEIVGRTPRVLRSDKHDSAFYAELWNVLQEGRIWQGRIVNRRKNGTEFVQEGTITPIRDEAGRVVSYVAVNRDVTLDIEKEVRQRQSQKLEAVGTLAGGIAHDFNNILTAVLGFSELAETSLDEAHPVRPYLAEITHSAMRARDLVAKILTFSRQSLREVKPVVIEALLTDALTLLRASLPSTIEIVQDLEPGPHTVLADPTEIHQLVMNLCTNSSQAIGEHTGTITVTLRTVEHSESLSPEPLTSWIELTVRDDGEGMTEEVMTRMFEPFFTTKKAGKGTGLGLAVVHGIVTQMGGEIAVDSAPGQGTAIRIQLPLQGNAASGEERGALQPPRGNGERILLVDDEEAICAVGSRMLSLLGYEIVTMNRASQALSTVRQQPDHFQLILTDQTMPEMTGIDFARRLALEAPSLPVVLMTGSRGKDLEANALAAGIRRLVYKPFRQTEVALVVRQVLDDAASASR
jgi:PAS domain S-box-containing protein